MLRFVSSSLLTFLLLIGCATKDASVPLPSLTEAYQLMDKGENAKAILLLESYLNKDPHNEEARILLASAYLGSAGMDVFHAYDNFKDVIFSQAFSENLWTPRMESKSREKEPEDHTPLEEWLLRLNDALGGLRQIVAFLARFPEIEKAKWPLLDQALDNLSTETSSKDVRLYRSFLRVLYLKAYLSAELLKDPSFGSRRWLCALNLLRFKESLLWVGHHLVAVSGDLFEIYPKESHSLATVHPYVASVVDELENGAPGSGTSLFLLQEKLRASKWCR